MTTPTPNDLAAAAAAAAGGNGATPPPAQQQPPANGGGTTDPEPTITQSHMNYLLANQKRELASKYEDYDDKTRKAEAYDTLIATSKSAEEQAADLNARLATRDRDVTDRDLTITRYKLAGAAALPQDLWDMVGGADEASIKENIEKLKRHMSAGSDPGAQQQPPQQAPGKTPPKPTPGQGTPPSGEGKHGGTLESGRELFQKSRKGKSGAAEKASA